MTGEDNVARLLGAIEKQGENFREDLQTGLRSVRDDVAAAEKRLTERADEDRRSLGNQVRHLQDTVISFGQELGDAKRAIAANADDISSTKRSLSDAKELARTASEHVSSSDLEAEARHALIIEKSVRKDAETTEQIAAIKATVEAMARPRREGDAPVTLAKLDENSRKRNAATWLAVVLAAFTVADKVVDLVTTRAQARQPAPMQLQGRP